MMPNRKQKFETFITVVALGLPPVALAQVDTSDWKCELCPFEDGYQAGLDGGASYVSDSAARFGNGSGLDKAGGEIDLGGVGRYAHDGIQLQWSASNLGLDSREFTIDAGRQGTWGLSAAYDELPYRRFDTTSTVYAANGNNELNLPSGWVAAGSTAGMTTLSSSLQAVDIGSDRKTISVGGHLIPVENFRVFARYRRQDRDGIDIVSGSGFTYAALLPRVIDYQTDSVDLCVRYANGPLNFALAWYGSFFDNNSASLTWDNAFFNNPVTPGFEQRRLALEPSNDFQQISLSGSYRAPVFDTLLAFNAASGRGEQNEPLMPYTINPAIAAGALPRTSLNGKVDTSNYSLTLTSKPIAKARVNLAYRFDERDNQTTQDSWNRVIVDTFLSGQSDLNTPYSFDRTRLTANGEYRLFDNLRVSAAYERTDLDRDFQEVAEQTEESGWGRARWRPLAWLDISAKGGTSKREVDRYDETVATSLGQNPLLRKYNLAHRYREFGELSISASPPDSRFSLGVSAMLADDSYSQSQLGLTSSENRHFSVDLGWSLSETASIYLQGGDDTIDADQSGSASFAAPDWLAMHEDHFSHYGGGLEVRQIRERTDLVLDYLHTDGETSISVSESGSTTNRFPDLDSTLDSVRLKVRYRKSENLDINLGFRYESFKTSDWALAGVLPDTVPALLSLGAQPYDYGVWVFSLSFRYLIGKRDISFPE